MINKTLTEVRTNVVVSAKKSEELSQRISRVTKRFKKAFQNQDVLLSDIYATELECLVESYEKNGKLLQESVAQLDGDDLHRWN
tara:strand:- start:2364 stop:2615 length:252 start_codon:yes stop_codon:yes gene_type:complete